eukprot:6134572-Prymnesium_polylepis.1
MRAASQAARPPPSAPSQCPVRPQACPPRTAAGRLASSSTSSAPAAPPRRSGCQSGQTAPSAPRGARRFAARSRSAARRDCP